MVLNTLLLSKVSGVKECFAIVLRTVMERGAGVESMFHRRVVSEIYSEFYFL